MTSPANVAIQRLLAGGYEVYLPISRPRFEELVISNRGTLSICVLRSVYIDRDKGATIQLNFMKDYDVFDYIIAVWVEAEMAWLVPYTLVSDITTLRLRSRDDLLIHASNNENYDEDTNEQIVKEKILTMNANKDRDFYQSLLNEEQ